MIAVPITKSALQLAVRASVPPPSPVENITADSTVVTSDNSVITSDNE